MAHMAYHDGLTDLPNRAAFLQALAQMIEACAGTDEEFAVLCIDLDGLKEINDVFGHAMGRQGADRGRKPSADSARGGVVARLSGDEFGLIIDGNATGRGLVALAEQVSVALAKEFQIDGKSSAPAAPHGHLGIPAQRLGRGRIARQCPARRCFAPRPNRAARSAVFEPRDGPADPRSAACCTRISRCGQKNRRTVAVLPAARRRRVRRSPPAR